MYILNVDGTMTPVASSAQGEHFLSLWKKTGVRKGSKLITNAQRDHIIDGRHKRCETICCQLIITWKK